MILLVVMAVVLLLAARNWKAIARTALDIHKKNAHMSATSTDSPETFEPSSSAATAGDSGQTAPPSRPSLSGMEKRTTAHTDAVRDALDQGQ